MNTRCLLPAEPAANAVGTALQFGTGGLVLPALDDWLTVTERVRGRAVREFCRVLTGNPDAYYRDLTAAQRLEAAVLSGKDPLGKPLEGHPHAWFFFAPDEFGQPARLIVWRRSLPFTRQELQALLRTAERPVPWGRSLLYLVPLPLETPLPSSFTGPARRWRSATPFVPPAVRHRYRAGRLRRGETVEGLAGRLLSKLGFPPVESVVASATLAVRLHQPRRCCFEAGSARPRVRTGYELLVTFAERAEGPILIGDSCHFGLGLFRAVG